MPTLAPSRRRGRVSELKALGLKLKRRQAELCGILVDGVGGVQRRRTVVGGETRWFPGNPRGVGTTEFRGDLAIRTSYPRRLS